ncbi:MAG: retropepsin-like aspartic protease [Verrucomicrobiota bacterium]|nr:retropepsin-like aspartic protease [Verrucomicrobiota bacterium]
MLGACLAAGPASVLSARADTVYLKNGKNLDGLILSETPAQVVVDLGVGAITLSRERIERIARSDAKQNAALRQQWQDKHFLHRKFSPNGWKDIAEAVRATLDQRERAVAARQALAQSDKNEARIREEIQSLQPSMLENSRRLRAASPQTDVAEYNRLVAESNATQAKVAMLCQELDRISNERKDARQIIADYLASLAAVHASFDKRMADSAGPAEAPAIASFLDKVARRLNALEREVAAVTVKATMEDGAALVSAVVNDRWMGRFLVDTGASLVTLSEDFALRAGLDLARARSGTVVVADGKKVAAKTLVLNSVQMGDARVQSVPAAILPQSVHPSVDGLLGMSFLRNFDVRLNGATGQLTLSRFTPP